MTAQENTNSTPTWSALSREAAAQAAINKLVGKRKTIRVKEVLDGVAGMEFQWGASDGN